MKTSSCSSLCWFLSLTLIVLALPLTALAEESYSPYVDQSYPTNVYWGDTHLHTYLSGDAYTLGTLTTPDDAYRFARGETIRATGGEDVRLRRPLDFLMIADHAENLGVIPRLAAGDPRLLKTEDGRRFAKIVANLPLLPDVLTADNLDAYNLASRPLYAGKGVWHGDYGTDDIFKREVWHEVIDVAEKYNDPGTFTTFAGFEYSPNPPMLHRNVLFAGGPEQTSQILPFSRYDSADVEKLWAHLQDYKDRAGSDVIAIPHNANLSGGQMFSPLNYQGQPLTSSYVKTRASMEPILEVTQIKGDSETHPVLSPNDEFADYESWFRAPSPYGGKGKGASASKKPTGKGSAAAKEKRAKAEAAGGKKEAAKSQAVAKKSTEAKARPQEPSELAAQAHARSALKLGLGHLAKLGVNPFKFGMIGSTDSHTGLATADEDNFWGKMGTQEPGPYRAAALSQFGASGYAGVWAEENTREALFAALKRREVYATTGPRITLRFFGGWDYASDDAVSPQIASIGYQKGVPMGGDLTRGVEGKAPSFLIRAVKDPDGANLDRVQVIKGWRDKKGTLLEEVYDVAWSDDRKVGKDGKVQPIQSTVDLADAGYRNSVGDPEFSVTWEDPDFDPAESSFYYVRVIEIPTPRWTAYDAAFYGLKDLPKRIPLVTQERAYSSPIWYTP